MRLWQELVSRGRALPLWTKIVVGVVLASALGLPLGMPWFIRARLRARASELGLSCEVGSVRLGLGRLWLRDVVVRDPALPGLEAQLFAVEVGPSWALRLGARVHGGRIVLRSTFGALRARWGELRSHGGAGSEAISSSGSSRALEIEGVDATFVDASSADRAAIWGVRAKRDAGGGWQLSADRIALNRGHSALEVRALEAILGSGKASGRLLRMDAAAASLRINLGAALTPAAVTPAGSGATVEVGDQPLARSATQAALAEIADSTFRGSVVALEIGVERGDEHLRFGPSRFGMRREPTGMAVELVPLPQGGHGSATPLTVRARLPLSDRSAELELAGGPVSLAALGVREGDFGLAGVHDALLDVSAEVKLGGDGGRVDISSHGRLENVRLRRAALGPNELSGIRLGWRFLGSVEPLLGQVTLKEAELSLGDAHLSATGAVSRLAGRTKVKLDAEVPLSACGGLLSAIPRGMAPLLDGVRLQGTFSLKGAVEFDSEHLDKTLTHLQVNNQCRVADIPAVISPNRFRDAWTREVKGPDGLPVWIQSGPGSPDWTPYEEISPHMETAVVICEDAAFFAHHGLDYRAIENSIRMNLEAGRFLRGGSTVTMQLAKNLYLSKEKTISRKLQEAVFTLLLEQELSKHELMELYLNVVEFGPGIYGIRQAARYYFNEEPRDLSLGQALYLGTILPAPDTQHFAPDGRVSERWSSYLRKLMGIARKIRRVTEEELNTALAEQVAFRKPSASGGALPPPDMEDDEPPPPEP